MSSSARASAAAFVAATETALAELLAADLSGLDLVALMFDGVHFGEFCCVVALGIDLDGVKHPLALQEGSTENATLVTDLLVGLRERGLDVTGPILVVIDGSTALRRACATSSTPRCSAAASCTRSATWPTGFPSGCAPRWPSGCASPTTPTRCWRPKPS